MSRSISENSHFSHTQLTHFVYAHLVRECLNLSEQTYRAIKQNWMLDDKEIFNLAIVSAPTRIENLLACSHLSQHFDLSKINSFYCLRDCWRLDIDESLARHGIIVPVRDRRMNITALRVFRHVKDERPFILKLRKNRVQPERKLAA